MPTMLLYHGHVNFPFNHVTKNSRFFFFNSLTTNPMEGAQDVANEVYNVLNEVSLNVNEKEGEQRITQALDFLNSMYLKELDIEYKYWNDIVLKNPIIINNEKYLKIAQECFSNEQIDYIKFMNLLKIIESESSGTDVKKMLSQIQSEVGTFQNAVTNMLDRQKQQSQAFRPNIIISNLFRTTDFAANRTRSAYNKVLGDTKTAVNAALSSTATQSALYTGVVQWIRKNFELLIGKDKIETPLSENQKLAYTAELALFLVEKIAEGYNEEESKHMTQESILERFNNIIQQVENELIENQVQDSSLTSNVLKRSQNLLQFLDLLEEEGTRMSDSSEYIKTQGKNKTLVGFSKEIRARVYKILKQMSLDTGDQKLIQSVDELTKYANQDFRLSKVKTKYYEQLKAILRQMEKKRAMKKEDVVQSINRLLATHTKFTMYNKTEFNSARGLATILQLYLPQVVGQSLGKTDVTIVDIGKIDLDFDISNDVLTKIIKDYDQTYEEYYKDLQEAMEVKVRDTLTLFDQANSFSVKRQTRAVSLAQEELATSVKKIEPYQILTESERKKALDELKNTFIIDNSVKHSDFIFDGYGFKGGSIGANVEEQIQNICDFYELGGITPVDRDWLLFAVINCGDGMLGSHLRPDLEDYFSVVAGMLMFRTGGLLADQVSKLGSKYHSANNIHILTLGGIYVPMSYVLKRTYDALNIMNTQVNREAAASKAVIRNNVTEDDKAKITEDNREIQKDKKTNKETVSRERVGVWYRTYKNNYGRVSINVQLLGGFLDLLDELKSNLP